MGQLRRLAAQVALLHRKRILGYAASPKSAQRSANSWPALRLICCRLRAFNDSSEALQISHRSDPGGSAMFRPAVVTHRVPSQTKEFSSHSVMCYSFRVTPQIATARFCTPLQRAAMNTPRFRNSLPMPASPFVIDAATVAHLCGRSLRTWWSWHAAGRCPQPVTRPHQTLTVVVVRRDRRIRGLKKSPSKLLLIV